MKATSFNRPVWLSSNLYPSPISRPINFPSHQRQPRLGFTDSTGLDFYTHGPRGAIRAVNLGKKSYVSPWDEKPYETLPNGKRAYMDEQDIVTFLDPPKELIPLDPASYNPAAYLWKKIEDIPEERRPRLLQLLTPRIISRAWQIAGGRYEDPKLAKKFASNLSFEDGVMLENYNCRTSGGRNAKVGATIDFKKWKLPAAQSIEWLEVKRVCVAKCFGDPPPPGPYGKIGTSGLVPKGPMPIAWMNSFKKAIFCGKDGKSYGRFIGGSVMSGFATSFRPLYFELKQVKEVMSTGQPCDLAYDFGDGLLDLQEYPQGFPKPVKHLYPFNDQVVVYIRHLGPGVSVGQAWQEGKSLQHVPQKLCGEILMVKDYAALSENH